MKICNEPLDTLPHMTNFDPSPLRFNYLISWKMTMGFWKIHVHNLMLHGKGSVIPHLVPKGPRFVEIMDQLMVWPDRTFIFIVFHKYTNFHPKKKPHAQ